MTINLGNIVPIAGKNVSSGIVSGIDTEALVEAQSSSRQAPIDSLDEEVKLNTDKVSAYNELSTLIENLENAVDFLRDPPGVSNDSDNIFNFLTTTTSSTTLTGVDNYITVDADPGANTGNFEIAVGNVAKAKSELSESFTSQTTSITEAAGGTTASQFSAGTFQLASNLATPTSISASSTDSLTTSEYTIVGTAGTSALTATGIFNLTTTSGDANLVGSITQLGGTYQNSPTDTLTLSFSKDGRTYTSGLIATNSGGGANAIAADEIITFTNSETGTSFSIQTGASEYVIDNDVNNINSFIAAIEADLSTQSIYQSRELGNFNDSAIQSTLNGLSSGNVKLNSNGYDSFGNIGEMGGFTINAPTSSGANDASISVVIDEETYQLTGLGQPSLIAPSTALTSSDYGTNGSDSGTTFTGGYTNIISTSADVNLIGTPAGYTATFNDEGGFPNNTVSFAVTINGSTYTAANVAINSGTDQVSTGAITFTDGTTSFDITVSDNTLLTITDQASADTAAGLITSGLANHEITQTRSISNLDTTLTTGTSLSGLANSNVLLTRDDFSTTGLESGLLGPFSITHNGVNDNTISVSINGETYEATGLNDSLSTNITLTSTTDSGNTLAINLADAGVAALNLSSQGTADSVAADFNTVFRTQDTLNGNLTLVNQSNNNRTLSINLADAGVTLDLADASDATLLTAALNNAFGTGKLADISIEQGDSLQEIAANINASSKASGVSASILQVSANDYRLQLSSDDVGLSNAYQVIDQNGVINEVTLNSQQTAEDAVIAINDIVITRSSNNISDILDGITFNLKQETTAFSDQTAYDGLGSVNSASASIIPDTTVAESGIVNFINAYNDFRVFSVEQGLRDGETGNFVEEAVLGEETIMQNLIRQVSSELNTIVGGATDSEFSSLANLGIIFTDFQGDDETPATSNLLTYDPNTLQNALTNDYDKVREIFEYSFTASSTQLSIFERTNSTTLTDYKVDIDTSRAEGNQVRILDLDDNFLFNADLNASQIVGQSGTTLEGLKLVYSGDGTDVITVNSSQGIADRLFNVLAPLNEDGGTIDTAVDSITDENDRLETERIDLQSTLDSYRQQLLNQYASLEAQIQTVNTLLDFLDAQFNNSSDS